MVDTPAAGPRQLCDLDRSRLFLRAVNSYTLAEAALRRREKLKPALRSLVDRLLSQWQRTERQGRRLPPQEALAALSQFMGLLDERMVRGQRDIEERYAQGQRVGGLFLAWGLLYLFRTRALDLMEEPAGGLPSEAEAEPDQRELASPQPHAPDTAALREFQMALNMDR